jgi:putative phage-type endonuclease
LSVHSRSLLHDIDSNVIEQFDSIVAKFVGGKRINYSKGRSYRARYHAAVVSFNTKRPHYSLHKTIVGKSPLKIKQRFELRRRDKVQRQLTYAKIYKKKSDQVEDKDYGVFCERADMDPDVFEAAKSSFIKSLENNEEERKFFEENTKLQSGSGDWLRMRKKLLTASNFQKVCRRRRTTSCVNLVRDIIYSNQNLQTPSIKHGKHFEQTALRQLEKQLGVKILECGMFIDKEFQFLGATPDGLIENHTLVEIKCPFSAFNMKIEEAIDRKKINFWNKNDHSINKKHAWYYQIQGQLHVTKRKTCILAVWISGNDNFKIERIEQDINFWKLEMEPKLVQFYMECILPELVDPRHTRNMKIRDPPYIHPTSNKG